MARIQISNNYDTTVASSLGISDTSLIVNSITNAPSIDVPGDYFLLTLINISGDREIVKVTAIDVDNKTFTIEREQEGTAAGVFPVDSKVSNRFTAGSHLTYLESFFVRVDGTPTRTSDTTFTIPTNLTETFQDDRSINVLDDAGAETKLYVESATYSSPDTTVTVSGTLPATVAVIEVGPDVDWLPRQANAATADYATEAGNATTADSISGKTISNTSGGAENVIPVTDSAGKIGADFIPTLDIAAADVSYDNSISGLFAINVNAAIDELETEKEPADATILKDADIGVSVQGYNADTLFSDETAELQNGYTTTENDYGGGSPVASGTVTVDYTLEAHSFYTNGGAHTLAPDTTNSGAQVIFITNNASAGAITITSWDYTRGDDFTTTDGDVFEVIARRINSKNILTISKLV